MTCNLVVPCIKDSKKVSNSNRSIQCTHLIIRESLPPSRAVTKELSRNQTRSAQHSLTHWGEFALKGKIQILPYTKSAQCESTQFGKKRRSLFSRQFTIVLKVSQVGAQRTDSNKVIPFDSYLITLYSFTYVLASPFSTVLKGCDLNILSFLF